jgi:hypothetical protein
MKIMIGATMTKPWKKLTALALAGGLAGIAAGLLSCKANDAFNSLQIAQVQTVTQSDTDCVVGSTATDATRTRGTLDVYLPDGSFPPYVLPLLLVNNLDSVGGTSATEMNNITLTHFTIELSAAGMTWTGSCPSKFDSESFTALLAPAGGAIGYPLPIIKPQHAQCLLAQLAPQAGQAPQYIEVKATITAKGRHGGTDIESAPFVFNVYACTGCLQDGYTDPDLIKYRYPAGYPACSALTENKYMGDSCFAPGQDEPILCCGYTDSDGRQRAVCPAVPTGTTTTTSP